MYMKMPRPFGVEEEPLYGIVSSDGGLFTIHFRRRKGRSGISMQGYGWDVFKDLPEDTPILRFDKSLHFPGFPPRFNSDFYEPSGFDRYGYWDTKAELVWYAEHGLLIDHYRREDHKDDN